MMQPPSSTTWKSRMFSQISGSVRGRSVPDSKCPQIRRWICSASGSMASRVRMSRLLPQGNALFSDGDCLLDAIGRGSANDVVNSENGFKLQTGMKVIAGQWSKLTDLIEREVGEFAVIFDAELDGFADLLMSDAEWHTAFHEIGGGGPGIHEPGFGGGLHALEVKLHGVHPTSNERQQRSGCLSRIE